MSLFKKCDTGPSTVLLPVLTVILLILAVKVWRHA
ncbi:hypothetical protein AFCDBAGC_4587 [Methylobacterium cerastii]|uniref:Uncharacterized protein n=1 Tax=Methylobacterium cerastii TaxID=932741 RepID=A0ABQ4QN70_9HYPH|nr:hypothetical protein AFCDBAGC_4587 [Methylobacterium cerastii]